jgi:DNA-binding transcriptional LysR family regulator
VLSTIELRHLHAAIALAEELNFTRASLRLHISQPALSKQITELEQAHGFPMFIRTKKRFVELTDAGSAFVAEAKASIMHLERAGAHGRAAHEGSEDALIVGYSPHTDRAWIAAVLANHLPLYPRLQIRLFNQFSMESVRSVMMGALDFALVMAPPQDDPQITAAAFARTPLYAALPETHPAAHKERLVLQDLANDPWILFPKHHDPLMYEAIVDTAQRHSIVPKYAHDVIVAHQAVDLVAEHIGVAILATPLPCDYRVKGIVIRPLSDPSLSFESCIVMRAGDNSRLANEFVRSFLRKHPIRALLPRQLELALSA